GNCQASPDRRRRSDWIAVQRECLGRNDDNEDDEASPQDGYHNHRRRQHQQVHLPIGRDGTVGFVTDLNFGQVASSISAVTHYSNTSHVGPQWFDPTQYYLTYTAPIGSGISFEAGRFVTLLSAEIIPRYNNQNVNESRGLLFTLGEPLGH